MQRTIPRRRRRLGRRFIHGSRFAPTHSLAKKTSAQKHAPGQTHSIDQRPSLGYRPVGADGARSKPSKEITLGARISLRQGFDDKTVIVKALSDKRKSAPEAQLLYEETAESIKRREARTTERRDQPSHWPSPTRPNKKQRRMIQRFKQGDAD